MSLTTIQIRRGTASAWTAANTLLAIGEFGYETDTRKLKVGDGTTRWNGLLYVAGNDGGSTLQVGSLVSNSAVAPNAAAVRSAIDSAVSSLVNGAGTALDTLKELADALGDDPNFAASVAASIASKAVMQAGALVSDNTKAPNAQAVADAIAAVTAGSTGPIATTYSTAIQLDKTQGREMGSHVLTANDVFTIAGSPAPVLGGNVNVTLVGDGSHAPDTSAFFNGNGFAYDSTNGTQNELVFVQRPGVKPYVFGFVGPAVDTTAPTITAATVNLVTPDRITCTASESLNSTMPVTTAFAVSAGHSITAVNRIDATHFELVLDANFVAGETARTLAYTQPGANKLQDLAGNLVASFSGKAITNNAGALPTITGAAVQAGAATVVEVTLSENYSGSLPAAAAFAVSGHTVSGIAAGSAGNKINLTVDAFSAGESRTLSYTKPGSNPITGATGHQQLANVSGISITDSVGAAGTLTLVSNTSFSQTAPTDNITAAAFSDWLSKNFAGSGSADDFKAGGGSVIGFSTTGSVTRGNSGTSGTGMPYTDGASHGSGSNWDASYVMGAGSKLHLTLPAGTGLNHVEIWCGAYNGGDRGDTSPSMTFALSDSSATLSPVPIAWSFGDANYSKVVVSYNAASAGQSLTIDCGYDFETFMLGVVGWRNT
jgi:hypothetical protein